MELENALPTDQAVEVSEITDETPVAATEQQEGEQGEQEAPKEEKKEKTPEQREIDRLRRRLDNKTRQNYELRSQIPQAASQAVNQANDDEPVTLTRAELQQQIAEQAAKLAPSMREQQAEEERRHSVVASLAKEWGDEEFNHKSSELEDVFGGLTDRSGKPKPATDAIFESDNPKAVIEYLTDPDNAEEAEKISAMSAIQAGRAITRLEDKLMAEKSKAKPKPSNAPKPIEAVKSSSASTPSMPDPSNTKAYIAWANAQEFARR